MVLVVDVGTSVTKAGLVDEKGNLVSSSQIENVFYSSEEGAIEHDPDEIFQNVLKVSSKAIAGHESEIDVLVLSSYQLGLILLDDDKKPLTGLITLLDTRSKRTFEKFALEIDSKELYTRTGCPPSYLYPFFKILWLREEKPEIFKKARYFLDSKSYIFYKLTGEILTEPSMASATQIFNIKDRRWDDYALSILGLEPDNFPKVIDGIEIVSGVSKSALEKLSLKKLDVVLGVYDGGGIFIGLGGMSEGVGVVNLGTTSMLRIAVKEPVLDEHMRLQTYNFMGDLWLTGEGINNAGITLRWLRNITGIDYDHLSELALKVKPGSEGLMFLPFLTGERDPRLRGLFGTIHNLRELHGVGHVSRSIFEGVALTLRMVKDALLENGIEVEEIRIGGSGTRSGTWLRIISDVLNVPLRKSKVEHVSFVGEAILGYVAKGVYRSIEEATKKMVDLEPPIHPDQENSKLYDEIYHRFLDLIERLSNS